ncbi:hypothetical protein LMG28727_06121 [Paraburkholderia kirstenboschensis]|nr:hypothetical protein [Paraburkholderia kirstenboschensis]CAD6556492.1 hypothetical protein LMG28727_06121 [Paraburkholderia kirstenboschensis]
MSNSYLDIRVAFALAKITNIAFPEDDGFIVPMTAAFELGLRDAADARDGELNVPTFFADEPNLAESWLLGTETHKAEDAAEDETSGMCSFCFKGHQIWDCPHLEH